MQEYICDGVGKRIKAIHNNKVTKYLYDRLNVIIERDQNNNTLTYTRALGYGGGIGGIIGVTRSDEDELESFYYHYNNIGSVATLINNKRGLQ